MSVTARVRGSGVVLLVLVAITACKPQEGVSAGPKTTVTAPAPAEPSVPVAPAPGEPSTNNARMKSLYADEFSGEWPVDASYVNLVCETLPSGEQALTATVEGTSYALSEAAQATADGGGVEELKATAKAGADSEQMVELLTTEATSLCTGL